MNTGDIVELTENYSCWPNRGPRVTLRSGQHFRFRHVIAGTGYVSVSDDAGALWQLPRNLCEVVSKAKVPE